MNKSRFRSKSEKVFTLVVLTIALIIGFPLLMSVATANLSFYDDHYDSHFLFSNTSVNYEDCKIYKILGEYDGDDYKLYNLADYELIYSIDGEEYNDETGEITNIEIQQKLQMIFEKNGITVTEKESMEN